MAETMKLPSQIVFGLDIGTRSIVGTVGYRTGEHFHVAAQCIREHETRAMLDGQIHDIHKVGSTINEVKTNLEAQIGRPLKDVCIAAAGRVLRTMTTRVECEFAADKEINGEDIYALDSMGVEKAYSEFLESNNSEIKFYCVGYSIIRYYLNGYAISNLEGHKAKSIGADIIATFLPDDVVDGLYKAVGIAGLEVVNLTLEPIAAIQVAIPQMYRMLNMALVDVGAGTSDISVTRDGSIIAYGMIPIAGDALTEVIAKHCLVDFKTAENIKRQAEEKETIEYKDIMGLIQTITKKQLLEVAAPVIQDMAKQVSDKIKELNGDKPVSAVFVVGGGGKLEGYTDALAKELGIQEERVAVRGEEVMQQINFYDENAKKDSLMVTPIGICLSFYEQSNNFIFVQFNDTRVKLYDNGKLTVADAAVQSQFSNEDLFPKRGAALNFTVNGKSKMIRGEQGEAAIIRVNGEPADIYSQVHNGDRVEVIASTAGAPGTMELGGLSELSEQLHVTVNGTKINLPKTASVNGTVENEFYQIKENDVIQVQNYYTVKEIAGFMDVPLLGKILVNDIPANRDTKVYENFTLEWDVNAVITYADLEDETEEELEKRRAAKAAAAAAAAAEAEKNFIDAITNISGGFRSGENASAETGAEASAEAGNGQATGVSQGTESAQESGASQSTGSTQGSGNTQSAESTQASGASQSSGSAQQTGSPQGTEGTQGAASQTQAANASSDGPKVVQEENIPSGPQILSVVVNKSPVIMTGKESYVFVDVFSFINFDLKASAGRAIVTNLNGRSAEYMEPLKNGDVIDIYWEEKNR